MACAAALLRRVAALARTVAAPRSLPLVLFADLRPASLLRASRSFIPFSRAGPETFATVGAKALLGTLSAVLLGATTSFPDVLHALERLQARRSCSC